MLDTNKRLWLGLQFFAGEGSGGEGGGSAATGESAPTAGASATPGQNFEQRLRDLGVPEDKLRRRAMRAKGAPVPAQAVSATVGGQETAGKGAAAPTDTDKHPTEAEPSRTEGTPPAEAAQPAPRLTWAEIMKDPEYNREMQAVIRARLKSERGAEEILGKLTPALELIARKRGMDPANMDYEALAKAISEDDAYYEDAALEMGVPLAEAKKFDQRKRDLERQQRVQERQRQEMETQRREQEQDLRLRRHYDGLVEQGKALKETFPSFDLQAELKNPAFARLTAPGVGLSVEDAYYAVHRKELQAAAMQVTARKTAEKLSNAIRSGTARPAENGTSGRAPSVTTFDYSKASPKQREDFKKDLRAKWARGEKVYPGR